MAQTVPRLGTRLDPADDEYKRNAEHNLALSGQLRSRLALTAAGGPERARQRHIGRGKLLPRDRVGMLLDPGSPFLELSPLAACGMYGDEAPGRGNHHRHRSRVRTRVRDRRQRRDGQGRHVLSRHRQEASAGPGNRAAEPAAVHLPGRLGWCVLAAAGRGLPGPGTLRPYLLQPGHAVGEGHPPDRRRPRLMHGRWRVCAGDERRDRHRPQSGDDLPGWPAARQGGDWRNGQRRGTRWRRRAHSCLAEWPITWRTTTRTPCASCAPSSLRSRRGPAAVGSRRARGPGGGPGTTARRGARRLRGRPTTSAR